jgi:hypothetical protein
MSKNNNPPPKDLNLYLRTLDEEIAKSEIKRNLLIEKALSSDDADAIYKAQTYIQNLRGNNNQKRDESKSLLLDPQQFTGNGYKPKANGGSYALLRAMSRTSVIKPIIETRKDQILDFCVPQKDRFSTGFVIRLKETASTEVQKKVDKKTQKEIEYLTEFVLNCGEENKEYSNDDFQEFSKKFIHDSLSLDQGCFEVVNTVSGEPTEFLVLDGATIRTADSYRAERNEKYKDLLINNSVPYYVQVYQSRILTDFYPWELCFGVRNPSSDIIANGYGRSELEDLFETVTAILNSDQYNSNFFKVGSNPKGILRVNGQVSQPRLEEFKLQWQAQVSGVRNAHKLPIIEAEKMDFINTQTSNKDMEYNKYLEFLIKIACAHYKMDPSEIGFPMSGSSDAKPMFEGNNETRIKYSKDKGLRPVLKSYQTWLNKFVVGPKSKAKFNKEYELIFTGIDSQTAEQEDKADQIAISNWKTLNEVRRSKGLKDVPYGDIILNPIVMQLKMMEMQQGQGQPGQGGTGPNDGQEDENFKTDEKPQTLDYSDDEDNPFTKALHNDFKQIFIE